MIAFDPDQIEVKSTDVARGDFQMSVPAQGGTAYVRISPQFRDFLKLCKKKHKVIGFEYDFESLNFGVVIAREEK